MNTLVKILSSDDGEDRSPELQVWHLAITAGGDPCTFCEGEFFGAGQSRCEFTMKEVERGGITCKGCLQKIRQIKSVKL
jgi:hypothetical protein